MRERTGGRLHAHEHDASYLRDGRPPPVDTRSFVARVMALAPWNRYAPVEVDETFTDGDVLDVAGGLRAIHTPGHTPGHASFLHEPSGVLITGDALFNWRSKITFSMKNSCNNIPLSRETAARLGDVDYELAAFTHGPEIRENAREKIRGFLRQKGVVAG